MPEKDTETMTRYDDYTVEELRAALQRVFMFSDLTDADMDEMDKILSVLREKAPFDHPHTTEEMWKRFTSEHAEELASLGIRKNEDTEEVIEKGPEKSESVPYVLSEPAEKRSGKKTGFLRVAMIAAAMVVIIVAITVTASAIGIDLWGWVPKWNDSTFRFVPEDSESATSLDIPEALKQLGVEEPLFPTWLPEGFDLAEQQITLENEVFLYSSYVYKGQIIMINIRPSNEIAETGFIEKNAGDPIEYIARGKTHYILNNYETTTATWRSDGYTVRIVGDISVQEMERIIDSVYEVTK